MVASLFWEFCVDGHNIHKFVDRPPVAWRWRVIEGGRPSSRVSGKETCIGSGVDLAAVVRGRRAMRRNCITYFHSGRFVPSSSPLLYTNDVIKYWFEFVKQRNVWTFCWRLRDPLVMIFWMQLESWAALLSFQFVRSPTHIGIYNITLNSKKCKNHSKLFNCCC